MAWPGSFPPSPRVLDGAVALLRVRTLTWADTGEARERAPVPDELREEAHRHAPAPAPAR
ncbi:hypothetical protein [Streptomyces sp. YIM B13518]|uniref:hypothetical protein n=1 Tax=Streptomyces sp. YIM B13518 TaxID=3366316 RepID=UPI00367BFCD0